MAPCLLFFARTLACLPLSLLRGLATLFGAFLWVALPSLRKTVATNLAQAQLHLTVRQVVQANARGLADMLWVWFNPQHLVAARCTVAPTSMAALNTARSAAQGLIVLTPHLGCFEVLGKWWACEAELTAMYRRPDKRWLARFIETARAARQLHMAPADASGVRKLLKALKHKQAVCILPDQAPRVGEGIWVDWFGKLAYTITLPAKLHLATGASLCVCAALPSPGGWTLHCTPLEPGADACVSAGASPESDVHRLTRSINAALEHMVLQAPLHYAWSYRRYKGVPPAQALPAGRLAA